MANRRTSGCVALLCVAGLLGPAAPAARAEPGSRLERVRAQVESLYRDAEKAAEAYNDAEERVTEQQENVVAVARAITRAQDRVDALSADIGELARAQYRAEGLSPEVGLVLSADPDSFLEQAELVERGSRAASRTLSELKSAKSDLDRFGEAATDELASLERARKDRDGARKDVGRRLREAERVLGGLEAEERERLERLEDEAAYRAQVKWLNSEDAAGRDVRGTVAGAAAVRYAQAQLGKPYEWGAEGPDTFDCSGLTSRAWAAAGIPIPRTSQAQLAGLPEVPSTAMRPGDLIVYFDDASHVGIYIGGGAVIHAPRPGRTVTVAGAGSMPILAVVRPETY